MTDWLPGSVEGTVPSQWLLDEKVRRQRAEAESERLRAALQRSENDWLFLFNLHPDVALKPEVRSALATANLKVIRAALGESDATAAGEFCGDPHAHSAHEWIRGVLRMECPGTWMPDSRGGRQ